MLTSGWLDLWYGSRLVDCPTHSPVTAMAELFLVCLLRCMGHELLGGDAIFLTPLVRSTHQAGPAERYAVKKRRAAAHIALNTHAALARTLPPGLFLVLTLLFV